MSNEIPPTRIVPEINAGDGELCELAGNVRTSKKDSIGRTKTEPFNHFCLLQQLYFTNFNRNDLTIK